MIKNTTCLVLFTISLLLFNNQLSNAQSNIKYGDDYIVFEAEDTSLNNLWTVRTPDDTEYLKYLTNLGSSPAPINNTYLEYIGPWQGANSELQYKFICPKTGAYRLAMRMHCPLRNGELADQRNDVFVKMEGNYTSGNTEVSETQARSLTKFYGRGPNKWGSCVNLEFNHKHQRPIYNFIKGEEYTLTMKGRSTGASYDYIALYMNSTWIDQNTDLALHLPTDVRPYVSLTDISIINPTPGEVREGATSQLNISPTPTNADASVTWSSSDDQIISVDANGKITAEGSIGQKATITAVSIKNNAITTTSEIEIVAFFETPVTSVTINNDDTSIIVGNSISISSEVLPASTHNPSLTWSSSDPSVASIDINGKVTGKNEGTTTIKATSNQNNTLFDEVTIYVVAYAEHAVSYDDNSKYLNGTFYNKGKMSVTINYNAGSLETVNKSIKVFLRELNSSWVVQNDVLVELTDVIGTASGTATAEIPLDGLTTTANLPSGNFYFLFTIVESTNGNKVNKGLNPIIILDKALSTNDYYQNKINIYPNPVTDYFSIVNQTNITNLETSIFDISGKQVYSTSINNNRISTSKFKSGLYIVRLKGDGIVVHKKLIIK